MIRWSLVFGAVMIALPAAAQDPVRVGIGYRPGIRPRVIILPAGAGLDSARAIVGRDLDYTDRFEVVQLPNADPAAAPGLTGLPTGGINYELYRSLSASWAVELQRAAGGMATTLRLHDLSNDWVSRDTTVAVDLSGAGEGRMALHRLSDALVEWITGQRGIASTRMLYVERGSQRIHRVDSDGHGVVPMSPGGVTALAPQWSPDGTKFTYHILGDDGRSPILIQDFVGGVRRTVPTTGDGGNHLTPAFSPDGQSLAFARLTDQGSAIFRADVARMCCVERLTPARYPANLSPTWSPDGRRIAFVSDRSGVPQIYVMSLDGTDQELLVPYDFGATGASYAPEWSSESRKKASTRTIPMSTSTSAA